MRPEIVLGLARAEARLARRLVRYWVFAVISFIAVMVLYLYYAFIHSFSSYSASVGAINPKYLIAALGFWGVMLFSIGLIFLGFDVRQRDEKERVSEVLDSRPYTNLELVTGRFLGLIFMGWLPMVIAILGAQLFGWLGKTLGWRLGETLEPWSIVGFVFTMAIPAFAFILAVVFLLSVLFRNRLVTALAVLVTLGVWFGLYFVKVPIDLAAAVDVSGAYTLNFGSEMVSVFTGLGLLQRAAVLIAALGLLALAAAAHPRPDTGQRKAWALGGAVLVLLGLAGVGFVVKQTLDGRTQMESWQAAHEAVRDEPGPDLEAIRGAVVIRPGSSLELDLEIEIKAPAGRTLDKALFTFNPGLAVTSLSDAAGASLDFTHDNGLLEVTLPRPLAEGSSSTVSLRASGEVDTTFAYLDSSQRLSELYLYQGNLALLGYYPAIFDRGFVALVPGIRWLPASGADVGRDDPRRPADFFDLDLTVEVPEGWLVAGPGRRRPADGAGGGRARFRFSPGAPVPEAALVASRFERAGTEVAGVELEILLHQEHGQNLELFEDAADEIRGWLEERFAEAAEIGLAYPYDGLTMVEVPTTLQGFGGGWRMDTVMAPPAMLLVRESSFPTARFDNRFKDPEDFEDKEGGIVRAQREVLQVFFENDFNGGNVFLGASRNFFLYQTASSGTGALALDFVCHDLTNRLVTGQDGYFSAHIFGTQGEMQQILGNAFGTFFTGDAESFNEAMRKAITERPEVWDQALGVSLADIDPWEDPGRTVNVLVLKGGAMSRSIVDGLGRRKAGELLAALRERYAGRTFTREDLRAAAAELGIDFGSLLGDWLEATDLPGFVASEPRLYRLADSEDGTPRYQVALHLRNDETAPGLARLRYTLAQEESGGGNRNRDRRWQESDPLRVGAGEAVEVGLVLSKPPRDVQVAPYLSLNRGAFSVVLPPLDEEKIVEAEPVTGVRTSDWRRTDGEAIVVDDLDGGFRVEQDEKSSGFRLGAKAQDDALDQGLPVANPFQLSGDWARRPDSEAWGKYRRTMALVKGGKGGKRAVFTADLPRSGPWLLELYMLPSSSLRWKQGTYHLTVEDPSGSQELTFDAGAAEEGWNALGELEIASGEVSVALSNETSGRVVVADAVRWRPVGSTKVAENADGE